MYCLCCFAFIRWLFCTMLGIFVFVVFHLFSCPTCLFVLKKRELCASWRMPFGFDAKVTTVLDVFIDYWPYPLLLDLPRGN